jgi:hypothetical protein
MGAGFAGAAVGVPAGSITATTAPTGTTSPSGTWILSTPAVWAVIVWAALSDSSSKSGSSTVTADPSGTYHFAIRPSVTDSPGEGTFTCSTAMNDSLEGR